jgi:hypothetical protein
LRGSGCRCYGDGKLWQSRQFASWPTRRWGSCAAHGCCAWCAEWVLAQQASSVVASTFLCVEVGGLVREFGKWEGGKAIAAAARFEENKNFQSRRGGIARKEGNTHWADRRSEAGRCGHDVAREARAMRTTSIQHSGKTSTQRRTRATPPRTKDKQPNFHPSPGETHLKGMKEFKCQNRLYRIDQLDSGSLDAPPNINNRGSHVGIASAAKRKWNFSQEGTKSRSGVGCGAAKSRSHRLSLALPWQPAGSRRPKRSSGQRRLRARAGRVVGEGATPRRNRDGSNS